MSTGPSLQRWFNICCDVNSRIFADPLSLQTLPRQTLDTLAGQTIPALWLKRV